MSESAEEFREKWFASHRERHGPACKLSCGSTFAEGFYAGLAWAELNPHPAYAPPACEKCGSTNRTAKPSGIFEALCVACGHASFYRTE